MDKVKIQEIADEAGLSNGDLLEKAKDLGFNVKAANSTISMEDAGILVDYAISGTLPKSFQKPGDKKKIRIILATIVLSIAITQGLKSWKGYQQKTAEAGVYSRNSLWKGG